MSTRASRKAKFVELCQECNQPRINSKTHHLFRVFCCLECKQSYKHKRDLEIRERIRLSKVKEKLESTPFNVGEPEVELIDKSKLTKLYALKFIDFSKEFTTSAEKTTINALAKQVISRHAREFGIDYSLVNQKVAVTEKDPITGEIRPGLRSYALISISPENMYKLFYCVRQRYIDNTTYTHKQSFDSTRKLYEIFIKHVNEN